MKLKQAQYKSIKRLGHFLIALLANFLYGFPSKKLRMICVTGTDGKTTTSTMIYSILQSAGKKVALISTVSAYIGKEVIDTGFHVTSPDPFPLQKLLKRIVEKEYEFVVLETTSHGIYQQRVFGITPEIAVLTNITNEHLDYHGSFEEYAKVKLSFIKKANTILVGNHCKDTEIIQRELKNVSAKIQWYELSSLSPILQESIKQKYPQEYNQQNASAAAMVAQLLNVHELNIADSIEHFPGVPGRMEKIDNDRGIEAYVDFAHTPNALFQILTTLQKQKKSHQKLIAVFGCAGLRDPSKRPAMGKIASELADAAVFTAEDPRTEDVHVIIRQIKEGAVRNFGHLHEIPDRRTAMEFAVNTLAKPGDIVVVCGKGHEKSINLDGKHEIPWSDQEMLKEILKKQKQIK